MLVKWFAHACFLLEVKSGTKILIDPFSEEIGYKLPEVSTDILLVSHGHEDHNCDKSIVGDYERFDSEGVFECKDVKITALAQPHDDKGGSLRGDTLTFKIRAEGINILHLGDIGVVPTAEFAQAVGKVDVLFIPVGGVYTVGPEEALEIIKLLEPNIIIPMHYKTAGLKLDIGNLYDFTKIAKKFTDISTIGGSNFEITADNLKKRTRIAVMQNQCD